MTADCFCLLALDDWHETNDWVPGGVYFISDSQGGIMGRLGR